MCMDGIDLGLIWPSNNEDIENMLADDIGVMSVFITEDKDGDALKNSEEPIDNDVRSGFRNLILGVFLMGAGIEFGAIQLI